MLATYLSNAMSLLLPDEFLSHIYLSIPGPSSTQRVLVTHRQQDASTQLPRTASFLSSYIPIYLSSIYLYSYPSIYLYIYNLFTRGTPTCSCGPSPTRCSHSAAQEPVPELQGQELSAGARGAGGRARD